MGLKCSLLGHEYGEPETEREREERGDEVIETARTVEVCERCGRERVVNENTEVRSVRQAPSSLDANDESGEQGAPATALDDAAAEVNGTPDVAGDVNASADAGDVSARVTESDEGGLTAAVERVETEASDDASAAGDVAGDASGTAEFETGDAPSAEEDDGVILTDDGEEAGPDRKPGEWPSNEDTRGAERLGGSGVDDERGPETDAAAEDGEAEEGYDAEFVEETTDSGQLSDWPDQESDDEGFAAEPATAGGTEVSFGGGLAPEDEAADAGAEADASGSAASDAGSGIASAGPVDTESRGRNAERTGELVCPECGERTTAQGSSLRAGDICPECHRGYLSETDGDE